MKKIKNHLYPHKISLGTVKLPQWKMTKNETYGAFRLERPAKIEVGDWVRLGQVTIAVVTSITGATPQAIDAHPELKDLELYNLSNGACLRAGAFVEVRKKSSGTK